MSPPIIGAMRLGRRVMIVALAMAGLTMCRSGMARRSSAVVRRRGECVRRTA
jgi:hypothetical protein